MINVELMQEVMQQIKDHPEQHRQAWWFTLEGPDCGTAMCFAGWACVLSGWQPVFINSLSRAEKVRKDGELRETGRVAAELLGLEMRGDSYPYLFSTEHTIDDLERMVKELINDA